MASHGDVPADPRRQLPAVDQLLRSPQIAGLVSTHGHEPVRRHVRDLLDDARERAAAGEAIAALVARMPAEVERRLAADVALRPVINATGVVVHTNLGRAPLPAEALRRVHEAAAGYSTLEFDLERGERGVRGERLFARLSSLLGAEHAIVVNNNAAAVLLALDTLAAGREVVVSRGELVEIGGSFRVPDVLRKSGARLVEVGTTNRTRAADYRAAIGPETALLLKVHPSNFRIVGFTEAVALDELVEVAHGAGVPVVEDLGSGLLRPDDGPLRDEPTVAGSLRAGVDIVTFSGDKLLGGPQAGIVAGRRELVSALAKNPLYRALRVDKMTMAALDGVLALHERGDASAIPVARMLALGPAELRPRAERLRDALASERLGVELRDGSSAVGGGAGPGVELRTVLVAVTGDRPDETARRLRAGDPPVVARVADGALLLDLRTVDPEDDGRLAQALRVALG